MSIHLGTWITDGSISPWQWGNSLDTFFTLLPQAEAELKQQIRLGYPLLMLDNVEYYFEGDDFDHLCEVIIKVWAISKDEKPEYFDYDWLQSGLTLEETQALLDDRGVTYHIERGRLNTSHIRTSTGILFAFYSDRDEEESELAKIHLFQ
jgi:hypothetical protein